jgi:hypothetical protein
VSVKTLKDKVSFRLDRELCGRSGVLGKGEFEKRADRVRQEIAGESPHILGTQRPESLRQLLRWQYRMDPPSRSGIDPKQSLSIAGRLELNVKAAKGRGRPTVSGQEHKETCFFSRKQRNERSAERGCDTLTSGVVSSFLLFQIPELSSPSDVFSP